MRKNIVLLLLVFLLFYGNSYSQTTDLLDENDVPLTVQAWFYKRYNNPAKIEWRIKKFSDKKYFAVSFAHKGRSVSALYDSNGTILEESTVNIKPVLSSEIKYYINQNYDKFKTMSLKSIKVFSKLSPKPTIYYQLVGRANQDDVSVWFDSANQIRRKKDFSGYASVN